MLTPSSYRDEPFSWLTPPAEQTTERVRRSLRESWNSTTEMAEHSEENVPLLSGGGRIASEGSLADRGSRTQSVVVSEEGVDEGNLQGGVHSSGSTVNCRVCDAVIELEGRSTQHVVKCPQCMEATPIRPAPPGKKYVRCPCNCLLICKASSTRIACPRQNCRRVITLGQSPSAATAMPAPTGTCRVTCAHCEEIFMFNTLTNTLATCPHCRKRSAVGNAFRRTRLLYFSAGSFVVLLAAIIATSYCVNSDHGGLLYVVPVLLFAGAAFLALRASHFFLTKVSTFVAPV